MKRLTDGELIDELKRRFEQNERAFHDLRVMTKKLEKLNQRLQESEAMKSNFLSNIRNEINNPLASIMGLSRQLQTHETSPESREIIDMIYSESFDLDFQLKNIFAAAELEAGESVLSVSNVDVESIASHVVSSLVHRAGSKGVEISWKCASLDEATERFFFKTDAEKLRIVLLNLLSNAVEFSLEGGTVTLNVFLKDQIMDVTVEDHGIGIRMEDQGSIFDRFRQLETGTQKSHRGHGLGLSVTKALVEIMNGTISFSSAEGRGSTFTLSIRESDAVSAANVFSEEGNEFIFGEGKEETF